MLIGPHPSVHLSGFESKHDESCQVSYAARQLSISPDRSTPTQPWWSRLTDTVFAKRCLNVAHLVMKIYNKLCHTDFFFFQIWSQVSSDFNTALRIRMHWIDYHVFSLRNEYLFYIWVNYLDCTNFILCDFSSTTLVWGVKSYSAYPEHDTVSADTRVVTSQSSEPKKKNVVKVKSDHLSDRVLHVLRLSASDSVQKGISRGQCSHIKQS